MDEYGLVCAGAVSAGLGLPEFLLLLFVQRPAVSAALSLLLVAALITLSHFKFTILWMVINFFDVLIIDSDTVSFLLSIFPDLRTILLIAAAVQFGAGDPVADRHVPRVPAGLAGRYRRCGMA